MRTLVWHLMYDPCLAHLLSHAKECGLRNLGLYDIHGDRFTTVIVDRMLWMEWVIFLSWPSSEWFQQKWYWKWLHIREKVESSIPFPWWLPYIPLTTFTLSLACFSKNASVEQLISGTKIDILFTEDSGVCFQWFSIYLIFVRRILRNRGHLYFHLDSHNQTWLLLKANKRYQCGFQFFWRLARDTLCDVVSLRTSNIF